MKTKLKLTTLCCLVIAATVFGQSPLPPPGATPPPRAIHAADPYAENSAPKLTRFDLNFPGGNPHQLVAAIEKAMNRPLNVIIPDEYAAESIPALRMTQITAPDLFRALEAASAKTVQYRGRAFYPSGPIQDSQKTTTLSFQTSGAVSDDSIWYFRGRQSPPSVTDPEPKPAPPKVSRYYSLAPYLEQGFKVEDITTAVQTAWKMLGDQETPEISFHKETKLLIAVGDPSKLETIDAVLKALNQQRVVDPATGLPIPQGGNFSERLQSIIQHAAPPVAVPPKTEPVPKPKSANEP